MTNWDWEASHDEDHFQPIQRKDRGKMPVNSDAKAKAASKTTWRSRQATKKVARVSGGIRNRRNKKIV